MPSQHERRAAPRRPRLPARKRWGQHFLANPETARRIVDAARIAPDDVVLEVGPGEAALTRFLVERARRVVAVEIDPLRARELAAEFAADARLEIREGDVLARPLSEWLGGEPALLVANLPYNAATPILFAALEAPDLIRRAVATVQKEVAQRFVAVPGRPGYGYLSVRAAALSTGRLLFDLAPGAFRPRPKVTSSVLELTPRRDAPDPELRRRALRLASLGFHARRKTLANALASAGPRARWESALEAIGHGPRARAEELSLEDFLALARSEPDA